MTTPHPLPRKPRNTRLSAYYNLSASTAEPPQSPLAHATHLTKTLPLSSLLQYSAQLHQSSLNTLSSLHTSTRQYYKHLLSTQETSSCTSAISSTLSTSLSTLSSTTSTCVGINDRLCAARHGVDKLDGARTATLLKSAAQALVCDVSASYRGVADLCTDPDAALRRLFVVARRVAVVLPAVRKLAEADAAFLQRAEELEKAVRRVCEEVTERSGERYGLPVVDGVKLRRLLGEEEGDLMEGYLQGVGGEIGVAKRTEVGGKVGVGVYVEWARCVVLPKLEKTEEEFGEVFAGNGWERFVVWVSDLLEEIVAGKVRRGIRGGGEDMDGVLEEIEGLVGKAGGRVGGVVESVVDGLKVGVLGEVRRERDRKWKTVVEGIVKGNGGDVDELIERVVEVEVGWEEVGQYICEVGEEGIRQMGKAWMTLQDVGKKIGGENGERMEKMGEMVGKRAREQVLGEVEKVVRKRVEAVCGLGDDSARVSGTSVGVGEAVDVGSVVELLVEADKVGRECGVRELCIGADAEMDFLLGEDDSLGGAVLTRWMGVVRGGDFASEAGVHAVQLDAAEVGEAVGGEGMFDLVGRAALERCDDVNAGLLEKGEVKEAMRQRVEARKGSGTVGM